MRAYASCKLPAKYVFRVSFGVVSPLHSEIACLPNGVPHLRGSLRAVTACCSYSLNSQSYRLERPGTAACPAIAPAWRQAVLPTEWAISYSFMSLVPPQCPPYITGTQQRLGGHIKRVLGCVSPVPSGKQFWGLTVFPFWLVAPLCRART